MAGGDPVGALSLRPARDADADGPAFAIWDSPTRAVTLTPYADEL
jgi:hypothetical protein